LRAIATGLDERGIPATQKSAYVDGTDQQRQRLAIERQKHSRTKAQPPDTSRQTMERFPAALVSAEKGAAAQEVAAL